MNVSRFSIRFTLASCSKPTRQLKRVFSKTAIYTSFLPRSNNTKAKSVFETTLEAHKDSTGSRFPHSSNSGVPHRPVNKTRKGVIRQLADLLHLTPAAKPVTEKSSQRKTVWLAGNAGERTTNLLNAFSRDHRYYRQPPEHLQPAHPSFANTKFVRGPSLEHPERDRNYWLAYTPCASASLHSPLSCGTFDILKQSTMKNWLQFITVPTADTPSTALILHYDEKRYLVGRIGEGTQRACIEMGISLRKAEDLFITGTCSTESTGGIIGMILTVADVVSSARKDEPWHVKEARRLTRVKRRQRADELAGKGGFKAAAREDDASVEDEDTFLTMYGPPNLTHSLAAARRFVFRRGLPVKVHEMRPEEQEPVRDEKGRWLPTFADENLKVWAMSIKPVDNIEPKSTEITPRKARKRTIDEANGMLPESSENMTEESDAERNYRHDQLRKGVLADMFSSTWHMDTLTEQSLDEVKLPAKIWVRNPDTKSLELYSGPMPGGSEPLPHPMPKVLVRKPWPGALVTSLPPTTPRDEAVSYILSNHPARGKFDPKRARALGVNMGPDCTKLTGGESVLSKDGHTITPDMVLGPERQGGGIAIIDLPSDKYVDALVNRAEWKDEDVMAGVAVVVWILGPSVTANPTLRQFMEEKRHLQHIVSSPDHSPNQLAMDGAATSSIRLAQIDMAHYPIPYFDNNTLPQTSFRAFEDTIVSLPTAVKVAQRGQVIQLEPKIAVQDDKVVPPLDTAALIAEPASQAVIDAAQSARSSLQDPRLSEELDAWNAQLPMANAEVIALGTGSALPSRYRNVSATLVRVPGYGSYLLDAGENTLGQLERVFKPAELIEVMKDLRMIWISHLHADHHLGTVSVIKAWHHVVHGPDSKVPTTSPALFKSLKLDTRTTSPSQRLPYLAVVSDINMLHYLSEYSDVEDYGYQHIIPMNISPAGLISSKPEPSTLRLSHKECPMQIISPHHYPSLLGLRNIQAVSVNHCHGAKAVAMTFPNVIETTKEPFKIAYSGDCRPSAHFAAIGARATVLIHEATFEDELIGDAQAKKHSTVREALGVGSLMEAKCVVLTHFSQRYQKIPVMDNFWTAADAVTEAIKGEEQEQERLAGIEPEEGEEIRGLIQEESVPIDALAQEEANLLVQDEPTPNSTPSKNHDMKVIVAFDYMRVKVGDMAKMERLRPALAKLFEEDIAKEEAKKAKKLVNGDGDADSIRSGEMPKKGRNKTKQPQTKSQNKQQPDKQEQKPVKPDEEPINQA
jgi:ribonuclease Z